METAFYDDGRTYNPASSNNSGGNNSKDEVRKRLTLDLNSPRLKKTRFDALLSSPDLNMLKLPSPELEKLIMQQNGLLSATPTPSGFSYPPVSSNTSNTRGVTRDQEMYVRGFDDALAELHQAANQAGSNNNNNSAGQQQGQHHSMETGSSNTTAFPHTQQQRPSASSSPYPINTLPGLQIPVKEEPRCGTSLSSSPPMSPIDMENQERIKLERKRQRNRIAASKCRRRKLERIARLEDKVKILKNDNSELATVVVKLRQQVCGLKEQVMEHINCGCQIMLTNQF